MIALTGYNVIHYLLNHQLISYEEFLGDLTFTEDKFEVTRNTNIIVEGKGGIHQYFVKQPRSFQNDSHPLQLEEDALRIIKETDAAHLVPDLVYREIGEGINKKTIQVKYDVDNHVLITKYEPDCKPYLSCVLGMSARTEMPKRFEKTKRLGSAIYELNKNLREDRIGTIRKKFSSNDPYISKIEKISPWILRIEAREVERLRNSDYLFLERLGTFIYTQKKLLGKLSEEWQLQKKLFLCNSDMKFSNILVKKDNSFLFVDWEFAAYAPEMWNVGGIVANFLSFLGYENPPMSEYEIWESIEYFLNGYFRSDSLPRKEILLILNYAGLILLQDFFEWASARFTAGDSGNPDKLTIGKACLTCPDIVWDEKSIPGLKTSQK